MAASDSYAVTLTGKCGAEISFSRVACVDLNGDFRNVFNMYKPDGIVLGKIQVGSTPNRPWHVVDETEPMSVLSALGYRHIVFQCNKTSVSTVRNAPANAFNVLMQGARRTNLTISYKTSSAGWYKVLISTQHCKIMVSMECINK